MSRSVLRRAVALLLGTSAALTIGAASPGSSSATTEDHDTAATVAALASGDTRGALASFPEDFPTVMGYRPSLERSGPGTVLVDPDGSCSSPVPLPTIFEPACRVHDLGYDLLRYARDSGGELGPDARRVLDAQLQRNFHRACVTDTDGTYDRCDVVAGIASAAVQINSWRQGYRLPEKETPWPYAAAALVAVGSLGVGFGRGKR